MSNQSYWSSSVSYDQFAVDSYLYLSNNLHQLRTEYRFPQQFFDDVNAVYLSNNDTLMFICIAIFTVGWSMLRYAFIDYLAKPIAKKYKLPESEQDKLLECTWNFCYYATMSLLAAYIVMVKENGVPLLRPDLVWNDWQLTKVPPFEYYVLYICQVSFYIYSIYAIIAIDTWRKDSIVMFFHHIIAILLLLVTFSIRAHQLCTFSQFLHDICDVFLFSSKSALHLKIQDNKKYPIFEKIANVGFLLFCLAWIFFRLYAYPLRVILSCITVPADRIPLFFMINVMMYLLLTMNLYWFTFILRLIYKVTIGTGELQDNRDYEKKNEMYDKLSDSKETNEYLQINSSDDAINKNDEIESKNVTYYNDLRKRSEVGVQSNSICSN